MPEKTVKRRLQGDAALASDDGPIFSTVDKLVEALKRSVTIPAAVLQKTPGTSRQRTRSR
jgi:hypothetical protein